MNYLQLCQRLVQETGIADTGPSNVDGQVGDFGRVTSWVNDAWLKIQSMRSDWNWMWGYGSGTLLANTHTLALPAGVETIKRVSLGDSYLSANSWNQFSEAYRLISGGNPSVYTLRPDGVLVFNAKPTEDQSLTYESYATPSTLSGNDAIPALPARYHMLIVYEALRSYAQFDEAPELERRAMGYFEEMLADLDRDQLARIKAPEALV